MKKQKCHRCGQENTAWHAYWACPELKSHPKDEVAKTQWMKGMLESADHKEQNECIWGRALIPDWNGTATRRTKFAEDLQMVETQNFNKLNASVKETASDGSGGPSGIPREARKVGAAAATLDTEIQNGRLKIIDLAFIASEVHGNQTVPRAEVLADTMANIEPDLHIKQEGRVNYCDAAYVVNGANKENKKSLIEGTNGDLWEVREQMREDNTFNRETVKVKAHAQEKVLSGQMPKIPYLMNVLADATADAYADILSRDQEVEKIMKLQGWAYKIAMRLATIQAEIDDNKQDELVPVQESRQPEK